jgi:opacity protein-like surface antigen
MAVALIGIASSALAQDADPEAGDLGGASAEGDASGGDDGSAAPATGTAKPISLGLFAGYGISLEDGQNPWGVGLGLRGGYNLDQIYLGARFIYYLGESTSTPLGDASVNLWELGLEVGYDLPAGGLTIRPALGLGLDNVSVDAGFGSASKAYFYLAPGASALFDISDNMFLGVDARLQLVFADPDMIKSIVLLATFGLRF